MGRKSDRSTGGDAAQRLIEAYSPRLMVRKQESPPCDTAEEQYQPTAVETVLGNSAVTLTREDDGDERELKKAPSGADIAGLGEAYHLNLPGDPLGDTCVYARDFEALKGEGRAPTVTYAHLARERGRPGLVVQYWFFWYFNQFNDLHEGDWEGIQIAFEASDPLQALEEGPSEIALYQHAGGEKASWDSGKVEKDGAHPVVYPAAGSHATFYQAAVYVENGRKGSGVGCDNTSAPHRRIDVRPVRVPTHPDPDGRFGWLTYEGRWGQLEKGFNNGPTGPVTKSRWFEPLTWMEDVRSTSPRLPAGSVLGPTVTNAFCGTVADVTSFLNRSQRDRWLLYLAPALIALLLGLITWRTRWGPVEISELRVPRVFGQLLRTAARLYRVHWRAFALLGLTAIPIVLGLIALSWPITGGETGRDIDEEAGHTGLHVALGELIAGVGQPLAAAIVAAAVIVAVRQLAAGETTGLRAAYRSLRPRFWRVVGAQLLVTLMLVAMALTVIGLPFAAKKYVDWLFVQQRIIFEDEGIRQAIRGSSTVVRGRWWYTLRVAAVFGLIGLVVGPIIGFALIFTALPLPLINGIGSIVFALFIPYVAIGQTLLYFDLEATEEEVELRRWRRRLLRRPAPAAT
ncbi:MAG TPA: hypothetical protein VFZ41_09460 [Solirubrobacterales bacterium]